LNPIRLAFLSLILSQESNVSVKRKMTRYILAGFAAAFLVVAFWPVSSPANPRWEVCVVDQAGNPVQGLNVLMTWEGNSESGENTEENLLTDQNGDVVFAPRNVKIAAWGPILAKIFSHDLYHSSLGPYVAVSAFGQDAKGNKVVSGFAYWDGNSPNMQSRLIVNASPY
jgi:hypothetical protein